MFLIVGKKDCLLAIVAVSLVYDQPTKRGCTLHILK